MAKTRVFEERYSGGILDINIFCFALLNDTDGSGAGSVQSAGLSLGSAKIESSNVHAAKIVRNGEDADSFEEEKINWRGGESQPVTASSSLMRDSASSMAEFRNFHSFTEQATPKTLTLIIKLIATLYIIMITIASVNLSINITRQV
jgi:hypothetical protein